MKILLIDDSKAVHAFVKSIFAELKKAQLFHAYDGEEGIAMLTKDINMVDLVLSDWEMPNIDGVSTIRALRKMGFTRPIIMVTTKNEQEAISEALEAGVDDFVMKPFTKDILLGKLGSFLEQGVAS